MAIAMDQASHKAKMALPSRGTSDRQGGQWKNNATFTLVTATVAQMSATHGNHQGSFHLTAPARFDREDTPSRL